MVIYDSMNIHRWGMIPESPSNSKGQMEGEEESHINTPRNMPDSRKINTSIEQDNFVL